MLVIARNKIPIHHFRSDVYCKTSEAQKWRFYAYREAHYFVNKIHKTGLERCLFHSKKDSTIKSVQCSTHETNKQQKKSDHRPFRPTFGRQNLIYIQKLYIYVFSYIFKCKLLL